MTTKIIKYRVVSIDGKVMCRSGGSFVPSWIDQSSPISGTYMASFDSEEDAQKYLDKVSEMEFDQRNRFVKARLQKNLAKSKIVSYEIIKG